jgi:hypothetical protein
MKRRTQALLLLAASTLPLLAAQQPAPPPPSSGATQTGTAPAPDTPYSGRGKIEQLNYDREGSVNGFLLSDGALVFTPPIDQTIAAPALRNGSQVTVQGVSHRTPNGRTVVDVQSMKTGGETIVFAPGKPEGPRSPRRPPRAFAAAVPPPPPPPPDAQRPDVPAPPPPPAPPQ